MNVIRNALKVAGMSCLLGTAILLHGSFGSIEGKYLPIATDYHIEEEIPAVGMEGVQLTLRFKKSRDCKFVEQEAYIPGPGDTWQDVSIFDPKRINRSAYSRPVGSYYVTWIFGYSSEKIGTKLRLVLHHKCWGEGLWETLTVVDLPKRSNVYVR